MSSLPVCVPRAFLSFLCLFFFLRRNESCVTVKSVEVRTEPSGLASDDPAVKRRDISISVGDATCQQKADGKMKGIQKEMLSDSLKFIRVTESGGTPMRGVLL